MAANCIVLASARYSNDVFGIDTNQVLVYHHGMSPRTRQLPADMSADLLRVAGEAKVSADVKLKAAVIAASAAGGSVREIARLAQLGPSTVQAWLHEQSH